VTIERINHALPKTSVASRIVVGRTGFEPATTAAALS
jgi:hypothetical protein